MNKSIYFDNSELGTASNAEESSKNKVDENGNVTIFKMPLKNAMVVLMDHPSSLTVYQYVSVQVLSGSVSVMGYELKQGAQPLKIFSSEKTGLIEVKTETFDRIWRKKSKCAKLEEDLYNVTDDSEKAREILKMFDNFTVVIVLRCCVLPDFTQCVGLYSPEVLEFNLFKTKKYGRDQYHVPKSKEKPLEFDLEAEKLASEINVSVRSAKLTDAAAPRIIICGPKNTGKSSLLRFLINKILSLYVEAYYLDTDPGQTEFTPPAVVSLTKVTKPVIGPPFMHMKKPVSMVFTGGVSSASSPDMYCKSISKLMKIYERKFSDEPLFVNTMGWMEGLGLFCLQNIMKIVKPTILIELVNDDDESMFDYREYLPRGSQYFQLKRSFEPKQSHLPAREMRDISVLAYLGKCLNGYEGPQYINQMKPFRVCWDKIPVFIFGKKVPPYRMIETLNASIVALCRVSESLVLESDVPLCPKTLEDEPDNECIGFGLVRAVNEKKHLLYIITPLSLLEIQNVNAILKGNVMVPDAVFLNQPMKDRELLFTNETDEPTPTIEEDNADVSMLSLVSASEIESPAASATPSNSLKFGRKKIAKRFKLKRK